MVYTAIVCPYMYMGRYCPKEGKNGEKLTFDWYCPKKCVSFPVPPPFC